MIAAYRKAATENHPDKNPTPEAAEKMKEINAAYNSWKTQNRRDAMLSGVSLAEESLMRYSP